MVENSAAAVYFHFQNVAASLGNRKTLKQFIVRLFKLEHKKLTNLHFIFCTDQALLEINRTYLNHNYYTDILTFDLSDQDKGVEAEIYISIDRVRENASVFHVTISQELHRVMIHGVLHLCGYRDDSDSEKELMRGKEDFYLAKYHLFHVKQSA